MTLAAAPLWTGCHHPTKPTDVQPSHGLVWVFPGVEGGRWSVGRPIQAFRDAGVTAAIEIHDWHRPFGLITNLTAYQRNRADASRIAGEIAKYKRTYPTSPVDLVGYSGGGGMAVFVAEALPEDVHVRNIVLAEPALSRNYDLSVALAHVDGKLINYYSKLDWLILGLGTTIFGTMDRKHTPSAGHLGFTLESAVPDPAQRARVEQHPWTPDMLPTGHLGDHLSILRYKWNKRHVARYLIPRRCNSAPGVNSICFPARPGPISP